MGLTGIHLALQTEHAHSNYLLAFSSLRKVGVHLWKEEMRLCRVPGTVRSFRRLTLASTCCEGCLLGPCINILAQETAVTCECLAIELRVATRGTCMPILRERNTMGFKWANIGKT